MKEEFIELLCCPKTRSPLKLTDAKYSGDKNIVEGKLVSADGKNIYPIVKGIPRFVEKELYSKSFGYEWKKWSKVQYESENKGNSLEGFTTKMFELATGFTNEDLKGKKIIEFGCGGGRYMDVVLKKGGIAVGIDLSIAVEPAYQNLSHYKNFLVVQGDILNAPFRDNVFDAGYCIGVLHHTPSPQKGLKELFRTIKVGGFGTCIVYENNGWYASNSVNFYRQIINKTHFIFGNYLALIYSHISARILYRIIPLFSLIPRIGKRIEAFIENNILVINKQPDLNWRILDTFDAITPKYASTHTENEVKSWFTELGCTEIHKTNWNKCGWKGKKQSINS